MAYYSVIIPIYNSENTIDRCIKSILIQHFRDIEIILIDDGSTDRSLEICKKYASSDQRITVINKENGGVSSARNVGLENAHGVWITFIDSDDYIEQNFFPDQITDNHTLVIGSWHPVNSEKNDEIIESREYDGASQINSFYSKYLYYEIMHCPWGKFFKREIINKYNISFVERYYIGEDTLFNLTFFRHCANILINPNIRYIYTLPDPTCSIQKYSMPVKLSTSFMSDFCKSYEALNCDCAKFVTIIYNYYKVHTKDINNINIYQKWITDKAIVKSLWLSYYKYHPLKFIYYIKLWINSRTNHSTK